MKKILFMVILLVSTIFLVAGCEDVLMGKMIYEANTKKDELRDKIEQVDREVNTATMELAYATAVAVECGKTNGELKRAKKAYNAAVQHQTELGQELIKEQVR